MESSYVVSFLSLLIIVGVILCIVLIPSGKSSGAKMKIISSNLTGTSSKKQNKTVTEACPALSSELQTLYGVDSTYLGCPGDVTPDTIESGWENYKYFKTHIKDGVDFASFNEKTDVTHILAPRGVTDIQVNLNNVSGRFFNSYLLYETDMWSTGFNPGEQSGDPTTLVNTLVSNMKNNGILLSGAALGGANTTSDYSFDVKTPVNVTLNTLTDAQKAKLKTVAGPDLKGVFRISAEYADYEYTLNGTTQTIRVYLSSAAGKMGDKCIKDTDGVFKWYDIDSQTLVATRPTNALSFWNNNTVLNPGEEQFDDPMAPILISAFNTQSVGMPIELVNDVDFTKLNTTSAVTVQLDLIIDGIVSFRDAKDIGEANLTLIQQVIRYDMPNINFKAKITIT